MGSAQVTTTDWSGPERTKKIALCGTGTKCNNENNTMTTSIGLTLFSNAFFIQIGLAEQSVVFLRVLL
jgi:hypothetical protein